MLVGTDDLHIHNGKHTPYVEGCGPQGPILYLNIKGLLFLSNRGSHLAVVQYGDRY